MRSLEIHCPARGLLAMSFFGLLWSLRVVHLPCHSMAFPCLFPLAVSVWASLVSVPLTRPHLPSLPHPVPSSLFPLPPSCRKPSRGTPSQGCSSALPWPASGTQRQLQRLLGARSLPQRGGACLRMELGQLSQRTWSLSLQSAQCPWLPPEQKVSWRSWNWWTARGQRRSWLTSCRAPVCGPPMKRMRMN